MADDSPIDEILGDWRDRVDRGEVLDSEDLIRRHPELADSLRARFRVLSLLEQETVARSPQGARALRTLPLDRYTEFKLAGEGGMGIVYLAIDTDLNREVAFKVVRPDAWSDDNAASTPRAPIEISPPKKDTPASKAFETLRARFLQEARVTGGLTHPGIVPVYELGQTPEGVPYYTMRFVKGKRTLRDAIADAKGKEFEARLALLEPFLKICDTLAYAHARGVIHRDLKPENVALGEFGEVVVLDWGLAKRNEALTSTRSRWIAPLDGDHESIVATSAGVIGTPGYMSPDAASGTAGDLDERDDIYSLGAILFEILTGRLPFTFKTLSEFLGVIGRDDAPKADAVDVRVPRALALVCETALARSKDARQTSVAELASSIRTWQAQSSLDRQVDLWFAEGDASLAAAESASATERLKHLDRALAAYARVTEARRDERRAAEGLAAIERMRELGVRERERAARRSALKRSAITATVVVAIGAAIGAILLDQQREEAVGARRIAETAQKRESDERVRAESRLGILARLMAVYDEELGDHPRERWTGVFLAGMESALSSGAPDDVFFFLERARSDPLLNMIPFREKLARTEMPEALREAERGTRRKLSAALAAYRSAISAGDITAQRKVNTPLDEAKNEFQLAMLQVRRLTTAVAEVAPVRPATLAQLQAGLRDDQAYVALTLLPDRALAFVVDSREARIVPLGSASDIEQAVERLRLFELADATSAIQDVRTRLFAPLALDKRVRQVIVSPEGSLLSVPFCLLAPSDLEVVYTPSATALLALVGGSGKRGDGVLAVGDAIGSGPKEMFPPLPGARKEALAIGTVTLIGADATEAAFKRTVPGRPRWRGIHLACHESIDLKRPLLSAMVLGPEGEEDGLLTALDITAIAVSSDVVSLSACDTGRSVILEGGGIGSLTRAFLYAGASRVLVSVEKADDEATAALMTRFYEAWNPKSGVSSVSASRALKSAQDYVRSQDRWRHPRYWAPWCLWGVAD